MTVHGLVIVIHLISAKYVAEEVEGKRMILSKDLTCDVSDWIPDGC